MTTDCIYCAKGGANYCVTYVGIYNEDTAIPGKRELYCNRECFSSEEDRRQHRQDEDDSSSIDSIID